MLGLQMTRHAVMAHAGRAPLAPALVIVPKIRGHFQHYRAVHDKAHGTEGTENAVAASKFVDGPMQRYTEKLDPIKDIPNTAEKAAMYSGDKFWRKLPIWKDVSTESFISYRWSVS